MLTVWGHFLYRVGVPQGGGGDRKRPITPGSALGLRLSQVFTKRTCKLVIMR